MIAAPPRVGKAPAPASKPAAGPAKPEADILFQTYFKSVGPRTYAAQLKKAGNGNHFLVLTEGKRDDKTGEVRKTRLYVFSEDFVALFKMLQETAQFIRANPVPDAVKKKRDKFWAKKGGEGKNASPSSRPAPGQFAKSPSPKSAVGAARSFRRPENAAR